MTYLVKKGKTDVNFLLQCRHVNALAAANKGKYSACPKIVEYPLGTVDRNRISDVYPTDK